MNNTEGDPNHHHHDNSNWPCETKTVIDVRKGGRVIALERWQIFLAGGYFVIEGAITTICLTEKKSSILCVFSYFRPSIK